MNDKMEESEKEVSTRYTTKTKIVAVIITLILIGAVIGGFLLFPTEREYQPTWYEVNIQQIEFLNENSSNAPLLICYFSFYGYDDMGLHVHQLAEEYDGRVNFLIPPETFVYLDDYSTDSDEFRSYFLFDIKGDEEHMSGVPLFGIITSYHDVDDSITQYFTTLYGSSPDGGLTQKANIKTALDEAIGIYNGTVPVA